MKIEAKLDDKGHPGSAAPFNAHPAVLERVQAILAHMAAIKKAPLSPDEAIPELSERQQECIEAFARREEIKNLPE